MFVFTVVNFQLASNSIECLTLKEVNKSAGSVVRYKILDTPETKNEENVGAFMKNLPVQNCQQIEIVDDDDDDDCQFTLIPDEPEAQKNEKPALQIGNVVSLFDPSSTSGRFDDDFDDIAAFDFNVI